MRASRPRDRLCSPTARRSSRARADISMTQDPAIQSAETLATLRALVTNEKSLAVRCEDHWAKHFASAKNRVFASVWFQPFHKRILHLVAPGSYCFTIARTRHFDEVLLSEVRSGIEQLVLL